MYKFIMQTTLYTLFVLLIPQQFVSDQYCLNRQLLENTMSLNLLFFKTPFSFMHNYIFSVYMKNNVVLQTFKNKVNVFADILCYLPHVLLISSINIADNCCKVGILLAASVGSGLYCFLPGSLVSSTLKFATAICSCQ